MSLTKKAVILFDPEQYEILKRKAKLQGVSVAALIRRAAARIILKDDESTRKTRLKAAQAIVAAEEEPMEWDQLEDLIAKGHLKW